MQHPSEKLFRLHYLSLGLALIIGIVFFIETSLTFLLLLLFYCLAVSILLEGLAYKSKGQTPIFIQQVIRAILILTFSTILFF